MNDSDREISFGVVADCQYAPVDNDDSARHYRRSMDKLQVAVDTFTEHDVDFIVHLGDFVDRSLSDVAAVRAIADSAAAPFWHLLGNHDLDAAGGDLAAAMNALAMDRPYYSRSLGRHRFIALDSNQDCALEEPLGSPLRAERLDQLRIRLAQGQVNAQPWNGAVGEEQLAWLRSELADADRLGERVVILSHQPVSPANDHSLLNADAVLDVLDRHSSVVAVLAGHNHAGSLDVRRGVPHITFAAMVDTVTNSFAIVRLRDEDVVIDGYGRQPSCAFTGRLGPA